MLCAILSCGFPIALESAIPLQVKIGPSHHGYSGGLPVNTSAPYYATANTEMVFHVSTRLGGDTTHKWKHIGNDEVKMKKKFVFFNFINFPINF